MRNLPAFIMMAIWFLIIIRVIIKIIKTGSGNSNPNNQQPGAPDQTPQQNAMKLFFGQPPAMNQNMGRPLDMPMNQPLEQAQSSHSTLKQQPNRNSLQQPGYNALQQSGSSNAGIPGGVIRSGTGNVKQLVNAGAGSGTGNIKQPVNAGAGSGKKNTQASEVQQPVQAKQAPGQSTTDYLKQKAQRDAIEHRKEAAEELRRRREESDIPLALRYTGFEEVAPSDRIVVCGYCRAENMVPKYARSRYRCYFCRENL